MAGLFHYQVLDEASAGDDGCSEGARELRIHVRPPAPVVVRSHQLEANFVFDNVRRRVDVNVHSAPQRDPHRRAVRRRRGLLILHDLRIAMYGQKRAGAETTRWTCEASAPATDTGPYFTIADGTKHPASRYAAEYIPPLTRSKTRARNARHSAVSLRARFACQIRAGQRLRRRGHH